MRITISAILFGALLVLGAAVFAHAIEPAPADVKARIEAPVKETVTRFYDNIAKGKAKENEMAFHNSEVPVTGLTRSRVSTYWQMKPAEYLKRHGDVSKYYQVDAVHVDPLHDHSAVARVTWRTGGLRGHTVLTLIDDGTRWRIVSFHEESFFVW